MRDRNKREVSTLWVKGTRDVTEGRAPFNYVWHNSAETMVKVCPPSLEKAMVRPAEITNLSVAELQSGHCERQIHEEGGEKVGRGEEWREGWREKR